MDAERGRYGGMPLAGARLIETNAPSHCAAE
jgi:hypothetical protein